MRTISRLVSYFLTVVFAGAIAGCGGASRLAASQSFAPTTLHRDGGRSWISPDAKHHDLLYVSDTSENAVDVYTYPGSKVKGTLTGFSAPHGLCADKAGDVFVVNTGAYDILEYAHGGTTPIATLSDTGWYPLWCASDPKTGNLAVTNDSLTSAAGSVSIYTDGKGTPKTYTSPNIYFYSFCGYDDNGNLYVDGYTNHTNAFEFAELPAGGSTFAPITLDASFQIPGAVQWDGKHIAVGDRRAPSSQGTIVYEFSIHGSGGKEVGSTPLSGSADVEQFRIQGPTIIGPNSAGNVIFWKYPAGGSPTKTIDGLESPAAVTVSHR